MHFLAGLAMIYLGYRIIKTCTFWPRNTRIEPPPLPLGYLESVAKIQRTIDATKERQDLLEQGRVLDQQLLNDAMARETRAKAALIAILQRQGVDLAGIQTVLDAIDNRDEGDGSGPPLTHQSR